MDKSLDNTMFSFVYNIAPIVTGSDERLVLSFSAMMLSAAVVSVLWQIFEPFPYGKGAKSVEKRRFLEIPLSSRFVWRYGFIPTVIVPWLVYFLTRAPYATSLSNIVPLGLYYVHYFHRSVIYPSKISERAQPSSLWFFSMVFPATILNSFVQAHHLLNVHKPESPYNPYLIIGFTVSVAGAVINNKHDNILTKLRGRGSGYQIPQGGLFTYVSCANYFGELLEWWGFAIITRGYPQLGMAIFSSTFLVFKAWHSHNWYHSHFGAKYPPSRKAIVPFIF